MIFLVVGVCALAAAEPARAQQATHTDTTGAEPDTTEAEPNKIEPCPPEDPDCHDDDDGDGEPDDPPINAAPGLGDPSGSGWLRTVTFDWTSVYGGDAYRLKVSTSSTFPSSSTETYVTFNGVTEKQVSGLEYAETYYWKVRAYNATYTGPWSATKSFSTLPPTRPQLNSPANGAVDRPLSVSLDWQPAEEAERYRVQVKRRGQSWDHAIEDDIINAPTTSMTIDGLERATTYDWRVRSEKNGRTRGWRKRWFKTIPHKPSTPPLVSPNPGATGLSASPTLVWSAPGGPVDDYDVQIAKEGDFENKLVVSEEGLQATSADVDGLDRGLTYHWRVRAKNAGGAGPWSERAFTTVPHAPEMPRLAEPARGAADVPLAAELAWEPAYPSHATEDYEGSAVGWRRSHDNQGRSTEEAHSGSYSWRVESASGCDGGCKYMTHKTFQAEALNTEATYVFSAWVKAPADHDNINIQIKYKAGGEWAYPDGEGKASYTGDGAWQRLEARLDLSQIADLEVVNPVTRNVGSRAIPAYWDDVQLSVETTPAATYEVQVATDAAFDSLLVDEAGLAQASFAATFPRYETDYFWRVRASGAGGVGPWSAPRPLATQEAPPRRYYVKDHLGSVRAVVDATGEVKETRDYYPFGLRMPGRTATEGSPAREDYTGHERDAATGLHYAGARYYMSAFGRWTTTDPILSESPAKLLEARPRLLTISPYDYVLGNPVGLTDPTGMAPMDDYLIKANGQVAYAETEKRDRFFVEEQNGSGETVVRELNLNDDGDLATIEDRLASNRSFRSMVMDSKTSPNEVLALAGAVEVREGSAQALQTGLKVGAFAFGTTAALATGGGIVAGSSGLLGLGSTLGTIGSGASMLENASEGEYGWVFLQGAMTATTSGVYKGITANKGNLGELNTTILRGINYTAEGMSNLIVTIGGQHK